MTRLRQFLAAAAAVAILPTASAVSADLDNPLYMDLEWGRVVIEMAPW